MPKPEVIYNIQVPVSPAANAYLEANRGDRTVAEKFAGFTKWFIDKIARGGLMIEPEDMEYLARLNQDKRLASSKDVVRAVEIALKREEGTFSFSIKVDPTLIQPLEEQAKMWDLTPGEFLSQQANELLVNGWWAELIPDNGRLLPMSKADVDAIEAVLGKRGFTAAEVAAALQGNNQAKAA